MAVEGYPHNQAIEVAYNLGRERYAPLGVDTEQGLAQLARIPLSLHCWQGDDVGGFEDPWRRLSGGILATGNYPGKARTPDELRTDLDKAYRLIPGQHRFSLHAIYVETDTADKAVRDFWIEHCIASRESSAAGT